MSAWTCRSFDGKAAVKIVPPRPRIPWWKGLGADSEEKREPVSDIDTAAADSLKVLDPKRPIREADIERGREGLHEQTLFDASFISRLTGVCSVRRASNDPPALFSTAVGVRAFVQSGTAANTLGRGTAFAPRRSAWLTISIASSAITRTRIAIESTPSCI